MAAVVRAVISIPPSLCGSSDRQSSSVSVSSASSAPVQHLIRLPRKCCSYRKSSSSRSSHSGPSLRFSNLQTNSRPSSLSSTLFRLSSLKKSAIDGEEGVVVPVSHFLKRSSEVLSAGSLVVVSAGAGAAFAETIDVTTPPNEGTPTDYLLNFLFIGAFIGLSVVTIGVIYLGVTEFLENRQRVAMQKAAGEEKTEKRQKGDVLKVGSGKGFGVKKTEKKTEKSE